MTDTTPSGPILQNASKEEHSIPLCIDLDGTLIKTDTLLELCICFLRTGGRKIFLLPIWLAWGRAYLKTKIAYSIALDPALLPQHKPLTRYILAEKLNGRSIILVTAASERYARIVAEYFGFFDGVLASSPKNNLRGAAKLKCLLNHFGSREFDYAGNDHTDIIIWRHARKAILVNPERGVESKMRLYRSKYLVLDDRPSLYKRLGSLLGLKVWIRNLFIFVPWFLFGNKNILSLYTISIAYCVFSLAGNAIRIGAALFFLHQDRQTLAKRNNFFASGDLPLLYGFVSLPIFLASSNILFLAAPPVSFSLYLAYLAGEIFRHITKQHSKKLSDWVIRTISSLLILISGLQAGQLAITTKRLSILLLLSGAFAFIQKHGRDLLKRTRFPV